MAVRSDSMAPYQKEERLKAARDRLDTNARRAQERKSWTRHLTGIAVNLIGSAVIASIGDMDDAVISGVSGIALRYPILRPWA